MSAAWYFIVLIVAMIGLYPQETTTQKTCPKGTYLSIWNEGLELCLNCTEGINFMHYNRHRNRSCIPCTEIMDKNVEVLLNKCDRFHDAQILCIHDYYRYKAKNSTEKDHCRRCSKCENPNKIHLIFPCQDIYDTLCCDGPNYTAALNEDGMFCKPLPGLCQRGQHLDTSTEQCRTCPPGTYMIEVSHNNTACNICQTLPNLQSHQVILQACNSTHPTIIGCENGFFRDRVLEQTMGEVICLPCRKCQLHELRACDMYHNTVCCSDPNMIVVDTNDGPECRSQERNYTSETNNTLSLNDSCTGDKIHQSEIYRWILMMVIVLPILIYIILIIWKRKIILRIITTNTRNTLKLKQAVTLVLILHLLILCLLLAAATYYSDHIILWSVVFLILIYSFTSVYIFISTRTYLCWKEGIRESDHGEYEEFHQQHVDELHQLLSIQIQDSGLNGEELDRPVVNIDFTQLRAQMNATEQTAVYDKLRSAIEQGADVNATDQSDGKTILMYAAEHGQLDFVCFLLNQQADVNKKDTNGNTALAHAAKHGHYSCVEKLINSGGAGNINVANNEGVTPLMLAMSSYSLNNAFPDLFINAGADVHMRNRYGNTALSYAVKTGNKRWVKVLIKAGEGTNINLLSKEGIAPIMLAVSSNADDVKLLDILIQAGADVYVRDRLGNNLLALAGKSGNEKCVSALTKQGLNSVVNDRNKHGSTPLMLAVSSSVNTSSCPELLIQAGANIHIKDNNGSTALFYALKCRNNGYVKVLIDSGANVDDFDNAGNTPLLVAARTRENINLCLSLLLEAGADINVTDREGNTALDLATKVHNYANMKVITDYKSGKRT